MDQPANVPTWAISLHRVEDGKLSSISVRYAETEPWQSVTRATGFSGNSKEAFVKAATELWETTMRIARVGNLKEVLPQEAEEELAK